MSNERKRYLPDDFDVPTNELEALKAARAVLAEEGHWCKGSEFETPSPATSDPFCGGWQACAVGAVGLVVLGVELREPLPIGYGGAVRPSYWAIQYGEPGTEERDLYTRTIDLLDQATYDCTAPTAYEVAEDPWDMLPFETVVDKNDAETTTLAEVLEIFDHAIHKLEDSE